MNPSRRLLLAATLAWPLAAAAARARRIVMFASGPPEGVERTRRNLVAALAAEGFPEGREVAVEVVNLYGRPNEATRLADETVAGRPDAILVAGSDNARLLQARTREIPIIFSRVGDPVGAGFVRSLSRPGGNLTGVSNQSFALEGKRMEILKALRPGLRRVAVLRAQGTTADLTRRSQDSAASALGLTLVEVALASERDDPADFAPGIFGAGAQGAIIQFIDNQSPHLASFLADLVARGIAAMFLDHRLVRLGGLVSLGQRLDEFDPEPARILARILRGERAADIPVSLMARTHLALNLRTAAAMKLHVPDSIRLQVDELVG